MHLNEIFVTGAYINVSIHFLFVGPNTSGFQ